MRLPKRTDFALIWITSTFSMVGTRTLGVAYPLLALGQTKSPAAAGMAGFALTVPILVFYVPWGVLADRISPRSIMLFAEFCRSLTVATVLISMFFGGPSLGHLIVAALIEGTFWVMCNLAETALFPSLVKPVMAQRAMAKSEGVSHLASLSGRPLGGYLFGMGTYIPFALNTALFAVSWALYFNLPHESEKRIVRGSLLSDLLEGFRVLLKQEFLRGAIMLVTLTNLLVNTLIMIFIAGSGDMSSVTVGLVLAVGGLGGVLGAVVAFFRGAGRSILLVHTWIWVLALLVAMLGATFGAVAESWPYFAVAFFATGFGGAMSNVAIRATEVTEIPAEELARVVAVARLSSYGALCLAAPLGGLLVTWHGVTGGSVTLFAVMLILALLVTLVPWLRSGLAPAVPDMPWIRHSRRVKRALRHTTQAIRQIGEHVRQAKQALVETELVTVQTELVKVEAKLVIVEAELVKAETELVMIRVAPARSFGVKQPPGLLVEVSGQRGRRGRERTPGQSHGRCHSARQFLHLGRVQQQRAVGPGPGHRLFSLLRGLHLAGLGQRLFLLLLRGLHLAGLGERKSVRDLGKGPAQRHGTVEVKQRIFGSIQAGQNLPAAEQRVCVGAVSDQDTVEDAHRGGRVPAVPERPRQPGLDRQVGGSADHRAP